MRAKGYAIRAVKHALHRDLARGWTQWRSQHTAGSASLMRRAVAFFVARETVGAFHQWVANKREADAQMHLTFASAAAILPIAAVVRPATAPADGLESLIAPTGASPAASPKKPPPATPPKRPPARPRMVWHSPLGM